MMARCFCFAVLGLICSCGYYQSPASTTLTSRSHTSMVWSPDGSVAWVDDDSGLHCGEVTQGIGEGSDTEYVARVDSWDIQNDDKVRGFDSFGGAVEYVRGWCKP